MSWVYRDDVPARNTIAVIVRANQTSAGDRFGYSNSINNLSPSSAVTDLTYPACLP